MIESTSKDDSKLLLLKNIFFKTVFYNTWNPAGSKTLDRTKTLDSCVSKRNYFTALNNLENLHFLLN